VDRSVPWAVLTVSFYDGDTKCAYAADTAPVVSPGTTVTFRPSWVFLTDEFGSIPRPCALPATTTRMVAELWTDADWSILLKREFSHPYTFVRP
jgi:hypothetical protein